MFLRALQHAPGRNIPGNGMLWISSFRMFRDELLPVTVRGFVWSCVEMWLVRPTGSALHLPTDGHGSAGFGRVRRILCITQGQAELFWHSTRVELLRSSNVLVSGKQLFSK